MRTASAARPDWIWHDVEALLRRDHDVDDDTFKGSAKDIYNLFLEHGWHPPQWCDPLGPSGSTVMAHTEDYT